MSTRSTREAVRRHDSQATLSTSSSYAGRTQTRAPTATRFARPRCVAHPCITTALGRCDGRARDRRRAARKSPLAAGADRGGTVIHADASSCVWRVPSRSGSTRCSVRARRLDRARRGQFFHARGAAACSPRAPLALPRAAGELAFLIDPIGAGTEALCELEPGTRSTFRPTRERLPPRRSTARSSSAAASASRRSRIRRGAALSRAVLGFRSAGHSEAAALAARRPRSRSTRSSSRS